MFKCDTWIHISKMPFSTSVDKCGGGEGVRAVTMSFYCKDLLLSTKK